MRKISFIILVVILASVSCKTLSSYYLKGNYPENPYTIETKLSLDAVWDKVVSSLNAKGIKDFKIYSKENGVIVSEAVEFSNNYTREDLNGKLINPDAFVVIGNFHTISGKQLPPDSIKGVITVRFKDENGKRTVSIIITNLSFLYTYQKGSEISDNITDIPVKSTGMLEKFIIKSIE